MKTWLKSRRFFTQVLCLTLSLLLILCTLFTVLLHVNARNTAEESFFQLEYERNSDLLRQSGIHWQQLISMTSSFSSLNIPYDELSVSTNYWARSILGEMIRSHLNANSYVQNLDVTIKQFSSSPSKIAHDKYLDKLYMFDIYVPDNTDWPYNMDLEYVHGEQSNKVTITLSAYYLSKQIFTNNSKERLDYLISPNHTVLLTNHQQAFFKNIDEFIPNIDLSSNSSSAEDIQTYKDYYYTLSDADKYGFQVLSLVPKSMYSNQYTSIQLHTILMAGVLFFVAFLIALFLTVRFYRPVKKTVDLLQTYIPGNLHEYENEISFIQQHITKYIAKENHRDSIMSQSFSRIQSAHTAVLQHQINSHFLFNTLESIKSISVTELGIDNEIESSILMLSKIIHEGVFQKNLVVTLSHELYLSRCYLELMMLRYPDVQVHWDVDEQLSQCQVLKFTLQPILENCFTHAFRNYAVCQKLIHIRVQAIDGNLSVRIQDNGKGITPDSLPSIQKTLYSPEEEYDAAHVGIRNVHQRIVDVFGKDYGIRISDACPGTLMEILYPISHGDS